MSSAKRISVDEIMMNRDDRAHRAWLPTATDDELSDYISRLSANHLFITPALQEQSKRRFNRLSEPHWTVLKSYRLLQISVALTILGIIIGLGAWWYPREPKKDAPISQPVPLNLSISPYTAMPQTNAVSQSPEAMTATQIISPAISSELGGNPSKTNLSTNSP